MVNEEAPSFALYFFAGMGWGMLLVILFPGFFGL